MKTIFLYSLVGVVAVAARLAFVEAFPQLDSDGHGYLSFGLNIAQNFCYSRYDPGAGACLSHWGGSQPPGYPFFIAIVEWIWAASPQFIRYAQTLLAVGAILWLARSFEFLTGSRSTALALGLVLALSPMTIAWPRHVLTETLAIATTTFVLAEIIRSLTEKRVRGTSLTIGLVAASFARLDGILLLAPVAVLIFYINGLRGGVWRTAIVVAIVVAGHGAWSARHVIVGLGADPLTALFRTESVPTGYIAWAGTWATDEYHLVRWGYPVWQEDYGSINLPAAAFKGYTDRAEVDSLLRQLREHEGEVFPERIDSAFMELAGRRAAARPLHVYVGIPLYRAAFQWFNPLSSTGWPTLSELPSYSDEGLAEALDDQAAGIWNLIKLHPWLAVVKAASVGYRVATLLLFVGAIFILARRAAPATYRSIAIISAIYLVIRSGAFAVQPVVSTRYLVEIAPFIEVSVCLAVIALLARRKVRASG